MARQSAPLFNEEHIRQGGPSNATFQESYPRYLCSVNNAIGATGVAHATFVPVQPGDVISNVTFITATTAAATPTAGFVAIYSSAGALLGQSADFATTARAANTAFTVALVSPITISGASSAASGVFVSISFTAATVPTLRGISTGDAAVSGTTGITSPSTPRVLAQSHGSAVGATAPATIATPTTVATPCYFALT